MQIPSWFQTSNTQTQTQQQQQTGSPGMWGAIAGAVGGIATTLINTSPKNRDANVAIAEANARAAEANASSGSPGMSTGAIVAISIAVIGLILFLTLRKS